MMFDEYKDACARLTLGQEKLEEMISMTESKAKKRLSRSVKIAIVVAACLAALTLTAFAASPAGQETIQRLFVTYTVTSYENGNYVVTTKDGQELHLTPTEDAITGTYVYTGTVEVDDEGSTVQVEVESDEMIDVSVVQVELDKSPDATIDVATPDSVAVFDVDSQGLDLTPTEDATPDATYFYTGSFDAEGDGSIVRVHLDQSPEAMTAGDAPEDGIVIRYVTAE